MMPVVTVSPGGVQLTDASRRLLSKLVNHRFPLSAAGEALELVADNAPLVSEAIIEPRRRSVTGPRDG